MKKTSLLWALRGHQNRQLEKKKKKKKHNLKVENYVLFSRFSEDLSPEDSLSDCSEGLLRRGQGGTRIYRGFCNKNQVVGTSKDYVKENQTSQVNEFSIFLGMERCKGLGSLKSFL